MFKRLLIGALCLGLSWGASAEKLETGNEKLDRLETLDVIGISTYLVKEVGYEVFSLKALNKSCEKLNPLWPGNENYVSVEDAVYYALTEFVQGEIGEVEAGAAMSIAKWFMPYLDESREYLGLKEDTESLETMRKMVTSKAKQLRSIGVSQHVAYSQVCSHYTNDIFSSFVAKIKRSKDKCEPCKKLFD